MIYSLHSQGWYIGITAASQAVKAGSTPVPCSKKERHAQACLSFLESVGDEKAQGQVNCPCANAFAQQKHFTAQKRRASTRRSASQLDSNYLTAEVNSAYNNSPLRCELTRDFARGTRGTLKCSGEVNSPSAKVLLRKTLVRRKSADFLDSGRKLKCSGEVNSPSAKVLLRKTLVRRKSVVFCFGRPNRYGTSELGVLFFYKNVLCQCLKTGF